MKKPLNYTNQIDESWADVAIDTFRVSAQPDELNAVVLDLEGSCPRCGHAMADEHWLITFSGVSSMDREDAVRAVEALRQSGALKDPPLPAEFSVQCKCLHPHPDPLRRSGLKGCGAVWKMRFELNHEVGDE
jgi:hypothetical protein